MKKFYEYEVAIALSNIEEYYREGERTRTIMILETDPNTKETNKIGLDMIYQADITNYMKIIIEFKINLLKSYKAIWDICNK